PWHIIRWLKQQAQINPYVLSWVSGDTLQGRFLEPVDAPMVLAKSMYKLCPDIVDQGLGDIDVLAQQLADSGRLYFWWD
ncbi:MAG: DUF4253 domain-containing protein, partial [Kofleriaceae bacterium]|nr:DUF4253 domain-containing protein [Kofleriaceae bacterium]